MKKAILKMLVCVLFVAACSADEDTLRNPNLPGTPGAPLSDEERIEALETCKAKVEEFKVSKSLKARFS
jgi:hypothetical protein